MTLKSSFLVVALSALSLVANAADRPIIAIQLDLARQKETVPFVKEYMRRMSKAGYNTIVLYLEDRVKTASYPYPSDADSYSPADIREIVSEGEKLKLDLVPVVSPLGHTERFLAFKEMKKYGEQNGGIGRFGAAHDGCFCLENPEARAWMENYIREVAALFPGPNFHMGFDETFDLGFCTRCRPIMEKEGLAALYMRQINWAHDLATKLGKRMWIWDDFFEYFDPQVLESAPKDIVYCDWNYDVNIEKAGPRGHFGGRARRDTLRIYEKMGADALVCPWFNLENIRTFTEYGDARKRAGMFMTQWEMETDFHSIFYPRAIAAALLWSGKADLVNGEWISRALRETYPTVDAQTLQLIEGLTFDQMKLKFSTVSVNSILNGTHETSALRYAKAALMALRRQPTHPGVGTVPPDQFSEAAFLDDLVVRTEMAVLCDEVRNAARYLYVPERTSVQATSAKRELRRIRARWTELVARRVAQWQTWRPGLLSPKEKKFREHLPAVIDSTLARPDVAPQTEWVLEVNLAMADTHGAPVSKVEVRTANGVWRELAKGAWKPGTDERGYSAKTIPVELGEKPDELRLTTSGYGAANFCHISLRSRSERLVPTAISCVEGAVKDPANLLVDDFTECRIGLQDCTKTFNHPDRAKVVSGITFKLN